MKHQHTNFIRLKDFFEAVKNSKEGYLKFHSDGYMDLSIENLCYEHEGKPIFSMTHYGKLNGDLMKDPDMEIAVDFEKEELIPLSFQNDYFVMYQDIRKENGTNKKLQNELDDFLYMWSKNIIEQGFKADNVLMEEALPFC